ncbi:MAG TPA: hypothetical protein VFG04_30905 [Planctomycetaceae bacterium]|jgi:hypothetical protein|nr:hypothetical protein [Planctomycetaceae bacterium]
MIEKHPKAVGNYLVFGFIAGSFVGVFAYAATQWVPAIAFGPLFGVIVAIVTFNLSPKP